MRLKIMLPSLLFSHTLWPAYIKDYHFWLIWCVSVIACLSKLRESEREQVIWSFHDLFYSTLWTTPEMTTSPIARQPSLSEIKLHHIRFLFSFITPLFFDVTSEPTYFREFRGCAWGIIYPKLNEQLRCHLILLFVEMSFLSKPQKAFHLL